MPTILPLTTLQQFRQVEQLEAAIWGAVDLVPVPILAVTVRRGAVLLGAYDVDRLVGFVFSLAAFRRGEGTPAPSHWSHMLGVDPRLRGSGLGASLKLAQRDAVARQGIELIEWTYDPLQSVNAHLNFAKLGVIVEEYVENIYGESTSALHGGLPTDRFICQWWINRPHVLRRIHQGPIRAIDKAVAEAPVVNRVRPLGESWTPDGFDAGRTDTRLKVEIALDFPRMLSSDLTLAQRWRQETRAIFQHYLGRGYRIVDFAHDRAQGKGQYLLTTLRSEQ